MAGRMPRVGDKDFAFKPNYKGHHISEQGDDWVQAVVRKGKEVKHIALTPEHAKAWVDQQDK